MEQIMPEIYTGAFFTVRYDDAQKRIGAKFPTLGFDFGFAAAERELVTKGLITAQQYPIWVQRAEKILKRAELEYRYRELNAETPDEWMNHCERTLMEIADRYEPILKAKTENDVSSLDDGKTVTRYGSRVDNLVQDTPYGELDEGSDYTSSQSHVSRGGSDEVDVRAGMTSDKLMKLMRNYESVENAIIKELGELFIHTVGMDVIL